MQDDEQAIRALITTWLHATANGDLPQLLNLMAEDVVFLVPGQPSMRGRDAFVAGFQTVIQHYRIESSCEIQEIQVVMDWAYCWNHLSVTMIPLQTGSPKHLTGYTLSILHRKPDGSWVIARDANLLTAKASTTV